MKNEFPRYWPRRHSNKATVRFSTSHIYQSTDNPATARRPASVRSVLIYIHIMWCQSVRMRQREHCARYTRIVCTITPPRQIECNCHQLRVCDRRLFRSSFLCVCVLHKSIWHKWVSQASRQFFRTSLLYGIICVRGAAFSSVRVFSGGQIPNTPVRSYKKCRQKAIAIGTNRSRRFSYIFFRQPIRTLPFQSVGARSFIYETWYIFFSVVSKLSEIYIWFNFRQHQILFFFASVQACAKFCAVAKFSMDLSLRQIQARARKLILNCWLASRIFWPNGIKNFCGKWRFSLISLRRFTIIIIRIIFAKAYIDCNHHFSPAAIQCWHAALLRIGRVAERASDVLHLAHTTNDKSKRDVPQGPAYAICPTSAKDDRYILYRKSSSIWRHVCWIPPCRVVLSRLASATRNSVCVRGQRKQVATPHPRSESHTSDPAINAQHIYSERKVDTNARRLNWIILSTRKVVGFSHATSGAVCWCWRRPKRMTSQLVRAAAMCQVLLKVYTDTKQHSPLHFGCGEHIYYIDRVMDGTKNIGI